MPPRHAPPSPLVRALLSLVFAAVIYADVAMIANQSDGPLTLPAGRFLDTYNRMFKVFTSWSDRALGFVVLLRTRPRDEPDAEPRWQELDVHELYPMPRGESYGRIFRTGDRKLDELAGELLRTYRRRHPELLIEKLRLYHASWPTSPDGYRRRYPERQLIFLAEH